MTSTTFPSTTRSTDPDPGSGPDPVAGSGSSTRVRRAGRPRDLVALRTADVVGHGAPGPTEEQHVLLQEPAGGTVVPVAAGRQLILRFRPRVGCSRWQVSERPEHLMPLSTTTAEMRFLVFGGAASPGRLRLERVDPDGGRVHETRDVLVVPVG